MKVLFICPSNTNLMPYLDIYTSKLESDDCTFIVWDRTHSEVENFANKLVYRDRSKSLARGFFSYLFFAFFCIKVLLKRDFDRLVLFSPQIVFFLSFYLFFTRTPCVIDYRDYHPITKFIPNLIFNKAFFVAISSPGFSFKLNNIKRLLMCHNYSPEDVFFDTDSFVKSLCITRSSKLSCIGAIRDFEANAHFISELSNADYKLYYHGASDVSDDLEIYSKNIEIKNCFFTGRYQRKDEQHLYFDTGLINLLRLPDSYNNVVALPNRLYNCAKFRRPAICYDHTELSEVVKKYSLGVVLPFDHTIEKALNEYVENFDSEKFNNGCKAFLLDVELEQNIFFNELNKFYQS
jgi:hypothetical protein